MTKFRCKCKPRKAGSCAGFFDHFFPDAFGLEDEFDEFAGGAFAAIGFRGVVRYAVHIRRSVFATMASLASGMATEPHANREIGVPAGIQLDWRVFGWDFASG